MTTPHTKNEATTIKTVNCRTVTDRQREKQKQRASFFHYYVFQRIYVF